MPRVRTRRDDTLRRLRFMSLVQRNGQHYSLASAGIVEGRQETVVLVASNPGPEICEEALLQIIPAGHTVPPDTIITLYCYRVDGRGLPIDAERTQIAEHHVSDFLEVTMRPGYALMGEFPIIWANNPGCPRWEARNALPAGLNPTEVFVPNKPGTPTTGLPTGPAAPAAGLGRPVVT